jgi:hypothetical protein
MVPRMFSTAEWLATLLRRSVRKGDTPNVALAEDGGVPPIRLEEEERSIALVQTADGRQLVLTSDRIVECDRTVLRYSDVVRCRWITDDADPREAARLKQTHWHRLILDLRDGRKVALEQLGQAVFPLLRFFESIS